MPRPRAPSVGAGSIRAASGVPDRGCRVVGCSIGCWQGMGRLSTKATFGKGNEVRDEAQLLEEQLHLSSEPAGLFEVTQDWLMDKVISQFEETLKGTAMSPDE